MSVSLVIYVDCIIVILPPWIVVIKKQRLNIFRFFGESLFSVNIFFEKSLFSVCLYFMRYFLKENNKCSRDNICRRIAAESYDLEKARSFFV